MKKNLKTLSEGTKYDADKIRWDLLPTDALREVAKVFTFGANKYAVRNWEKGILYHRCYGAALRHLTSFWEEENLDEETGYEHLAHAVCCLLFLLSFQLREMQDFDDRPNIKENY